MSRTITLSLMSLALASMISVASAATLASVNGKDITTADADAFVKKALPGMTYDKLDPKMKRQIVDQLINQMLIRNEVLKSGIENSTEFKTRYAALKDDLAVDMWMKSQMAKITVSDKEAKDFYNTNKEKMKQGDKTVPFEKAKSDIMNFIKLEKFKASMNKTTESLRSGAKVEVKL
ncbi:MAG: hypothetical protein AB7S65_06230 [Sulfuricurvum sp.]